MLETKIEELTKALTENTVALNAILKAGGAAAPAGETAAARKKREAAEAAAAAAAAAPAGPSLQDFRDVAAKIVDAGQGSQLETLAKKHGLARVSAAHGTDKAQVVFDELQAINAKL